MGGAGFASEEGAFALFGAFQGAVSAGVAAGDVQEAAFGAVEFAHGLAGGG